MIKRSPPLRCCCVARARLAVSRRRPASPLAPSLFVAAHSLVLLFFNTDARTLQKGFIEKRRGGVQRTARARSTGTYPTAAAGVKRTGAAAHSTEEERRCERLRAPSLSTVRSRRSRRMGRQNKYDQTTAKGKRGKGCVAVVRDSVGGGAPRGGGRVFGRYMFHRIEKEGGRGGYIWRGVAWCVGGGGIRCVCVVRRRRAVRSSVVLKKCTEGDTHSATHTQNRALLLFFGQWREQV